MGDSAGKSTDGRPVARQNVDGILNMSPNGGDSAGKLSTEAVHEL